MLHTGHCGERHEHLPLEGTQKLAFIWGSLRFDSYDKCTIVVEPGFDLREVQEGAQEEYGTGDQDQ